MPSIALRQYTFKVGPLPFAHNFLVLYDDQGNVLAELHGKPADPTTGWELKKNHWPQQQLSEPHPY
jgi:hypothetical protein